VTLHRPSNVDAPDSLARILAYLNELSASVPVVFPMHPRTKKNIERFGINMTFYDAFRIVEPVRYSEFITLQKNAHFVLTDSGAIQEETTYLKLPCLTLRPNTERPITVIRGTNSLVGTDPEKISQGVADILDGSSVVGSRPPLWDGRASKRIADVIEVWEPGQISVPERRCALASKEFITR